MGVQGIVWRPGAGVRLERCHKGTLDARLQEVRQGGAQDLQEWLGVWGLGVVCGDLGLGCNCYDAITRPRP